MTSKLLKKIGGALGYKLFNKNYVKNNRLCGEYSYLKIKNILNYLFENKIVESLIQIGANDGESFDELSFFIKKYPVNSILVEPIQEHFEKLVSTYSSNNQIKLENVAISEEIGKKFLYSVKKDFKNIYGKHADAISSFSLDHLLKHNIKKKHIEKLSIKSISIGKLIEKYKLNNIDLFYVDAEGYDGEIVLSFLKNSIECKVIVFEYIHIDNEIFKTLINKLQEKDFKFFAISENLVCLKNKIKLKI